MGQKQHCLDPDGLRRLEKARELAGSKMDEVPKAVEAVLNGIDDLERVVLLPRRRYLRYILGWKLRGYINHEKRKAAKYKQRPAKTLEEMFGHEQAAEMRKEAYLRDLSTPPSAR